MQKSFGLNLKTNMNRLSVLLSKQRTFIVNMWQLPKKNIIVGKSWLPDGKFHSTANFTAQGGRS